MSNVSALFSSPPTLLLPSNLCFLSDINMTFLTLVHLSDLSYQSFPCQMHTECYFALAAAHVHCVLCYQHRVKHNPSKGDASFSLDHYHENVLVGVSQGDMSHRDRPEPRPAS